MRLDKLLEIELFGSKREIKALLNRKLVRVDGKIITQGNQNVDAFFQEVMVKHQKIQRKTHVYFMLNKPAGVVTAVKDSYHQTVLDLLQPKDCTEKLYPVGRLDRDTEGLVLLTDNGQLGYQLLLPKKKVTKCYHVNVNAELTEKDCDRFREGVRFHDGTICSSAKLSILSQSKTSSEAFLEITEGKFHQVKKMFLSVNKKVTFLKRIAMGPIYLDPRLAKGAYRSLTRAEMERLRPYFTVHQK